MACISAFMQKVLPVLDNCACFLQSCLISPPWCGVYRACWLCWLYRPYILRTSILHRLGSQGALLLSNSYRPGAVCSSQVIIGIYLCCSFSFLACLHGYMARILSISPRAQGSATRGKTRQTRLSSMLTSTTIRKPR